MKRQPIATNQFRLDFEPGITEKFRTLKRCVATVVYSSRIGLEGCAIACDVSPSTLSKMLNDQDDVENRRHLPADFVWPIMVATNDFRPLHWLQEKAEKAHPDEDSRRIDVALATVEQLAPALLDAVSMLKRAKGGQR